MIITIHGYRQEGKSTTAVLIRNFLRMFGFTAEVKEATLQMQAHFDYMAQRFHGTRLEARDVEIRTEDGYPTLEENQHLKAEVERLESEVRLLELERDRLQGRLSDMYDRSRYY